MKSVKLVLSIGCLIFANLINAQIAELKSPNEKIHLQLHENDGKISYDIHYSEEQFLEDSPLGLKTSLGDFSANLKFISSEENTIENSYDLNRAKVSHVDYKANELVSKFVNENEDTLFVYFRLSNRDVAYSYKLKSKVGRSNVKIFEEASGFNLPDYATTYITPQALPMTGWSETKPSYEEEYTLNGKLGEPSTYGEGYTFPALFKLGENGWILISETGVDGGYPGSRLSESTADGRFTVQFPQEGENNGIGDTFAAMAMPAKTPWRTITLGESLKPIVESTVAFDLVEQKYEPSIDYQMGRATWSWIVWQDNSINYNDQLKYIDMASALGFEYVLIDNWWDNNIGYKRMEELVKYAQSKDVDVLLWYNSNGYWNEAPQTPQDKMNTSAARKKEMEWLQKIGVKGLKVDFFGGDKQTTMKLYEDILTEANDYGLGITFHGCTIPRGWQKMYPNYVTSEAVLASENLIFRQDALDKHALNSTILPFTRNAVGAMDFAPVFLNQKMSRDQKGGTIRSTTDAFELATSILYFSPIQHFGLTPNNLEEQPDHVLDFIKEVPSVWDETIYIGGTPEDYCALARRKGDQWYVAVTNATKEKQKIELELPMLAGKELKHLYDNKDKTAGYKTAKIKNNGTLKIELLPEGGAVLY
ncbi:glycoside hydrolase family 97 catalytic domain-containing protein [Zunongwangia sp. SCSIO 43204]|uniref:glycoside hydrolase family 97 protein n=1 Tax=Zunongwangia sp. SCSIO 43204 TaxID=2779359 RepID=UPI001CAA36F2|nr:glycoside hydrolase family 97 protein [Zunongwangia sp. SCSIO 43204]UAB85227.1 glycoside hydrolase family 97 catalytic domain-containing protein [Zunongwangia sp. SCSIO 43204]